MDLLEILKSVELFEGLTAGELRKVQTLCQTARYQENEVIAEQGSPEEELFIIQEGFVEVSVHGRDGRIGKVIVNLGTGQTVGEMSLIEQGKRSATVRAVSSPTIVQIISQADFEALCESDCHIGYVVMRNLAADLSFRLRQRHLSGMTSG